MRQNAPTAFQFQNIFRGLHPKPRTAGVGYTPTGHAGVGPGGHGISPKAASDVWDIHALQKNRGWLDAGGMY